MITEEFPDEIIIRQISEQKRQHGIQEEKTNDIDISKGYVYINDEKVMFSNFKLPGNKVSVMVPEEFLTKDNAETANGKTEFSNYDKSVCLLFETFLKPEQTEIHQGINYSESTRRSDDGTSEHYNLNFIISFGMDDMNGVSIKGEFTCADYRLADWKDIFFQIMRSIQ